MRTAIEGRALVSLKGVRKAFGSFEVLRGVELGVAIDRFAGAVGIRDAQGAWGVLSGGLINRTEAFRLAVVAAFAPFYNAKVYHAASTAR